MGSEGGGAAGVAVGGSHWDLPVLRSMKNLVDWLVGCLVGLGETGGTIVCSGRRTGLSIPLGRREAAGLVAERRTWCMCEREVVRWMRERGRERER